MSRIHEALKKAEEEKLARVTESPAAVHPLIDEPFVPQSVPQTVVAAPPLSPGRNGADVSGPLTWETVVAVCPQRTWTPRKGMLLLASTGQHQMGTEEFRTLRSRLYQVREKQPLKTILVGSALPAEGKSFVSANLAQMLARQHGRRVVLLDCDLRRPHLHESFGTTCEPGVSEYLRGEVDELSIVQRGPMENLAFIPGGRQLSNPAEMIGNGRLELLVKKLGDAFDWIIIDSAPAVPVADATLIARFCDGVLLVVHAGKTPYDLAQRARQEFKNMPVLGVVLNRVEPESTYVSYYYYYGAYGKPGANGAG